MSQQQQALDFVTNYVSALPAHAIALLIGFTVFCVVMMLIQFSRS